MGPTEDAKQLVPPTMPKKVVYVCHQLSMGHGWWYVCPTLGRGSSGWEKYLQFFATFPIHLSQLPKLVSLVDILGQPTCPEVVDQRQFLGYVSCSPHGYCKESILQGVLVSS